MDWKETRTTGEFCPSISSLEINDHLSKLLANVNYDSVCNFEKEIEKDLLPYIAEDQLQAGLRLEMNADGSELTVAIVYPDQKGTEKLVIMKQGKVQADAMPNLRKINEDMGLHPDTGMQ